MSKPKDIPQDVWDKASETFDLMLCNDGYEGARDDSIADLARAIMAAKAEQREVDAQIALANDVQVAIWELSELSLARLATNYASAEIAAAIRKRGEG